MDRLRRMPTPLLAVLTASLLANLDRKSVV